MSSGDDPGSSIGCGGIAAKRCRNPGAPIASAARYRAIAMLPQPTITTRIDVPPTVELTLCVAQMS
jgi:hypothetical protein